MNTVEELRKLSERALDLENQEHLTRLSERDTERHLIEPFIKALGYNLFDLNEVETQPSTPFATRSVKCDYAIKKNSARIILIEAKKPRLKLGNPDQLSDYFGQESEVWLGVFTNGIEYRFYSGNSPNNIKRMDQQQFLTLDLLNFDEEIAETVSKFAKARFDPNEVRELARERKFQQKYETAIRDALREELAEPSEELFLLLINKVGAEDEELERLRPLVKEIANQILNLPPPPIGGTPPPKLPTDDESGIPIRFIDGRQIYKASLIQGGMVRLDDGSIHRVSGACIKLGRRPSYNGWIEWKYYDKQAGRELFIDQLRELKDDEQIRRTGMSIGWISRQKPKYF